MFHEWIFTMNKWALFLPEAILLMAALLIPFVRGVDGGHARSRLANVAILAAFASLFWMLWENTTSAYSFDRFFGLAGERILGGFYEVTAFALFFKIIFLLVALLVAWVSSDALQEKRESAEYYSLLLIATAGMMVVASARDLITLFIGLETAALSSYTLVGLRRRSLESNEAATKFFIVGALSAALTLYGISLLYTLLGTVNLYAIQDALGAGEVSRPLLLVAMAFLVAGFGFKVTSVPFHMWAPDVYQGAPDTVSAFISGASKKMGFAAFFKVFFVALLALRFEWGTLLGVLAVGTMVVGNVAALQQTRLKRLLAWSSIAQAGYILIAIPVATEAALTGAFFHALGHAIMAGGAFVLVAVLAARGVGDSIEEYRGLARRSPLAAFTLALLMLSLAGIPPLIGFWGKFLLFSGAIQAGVAQQNDWFLFLAVAGIATSAVSVVYYVRVVRACYLDDAAEAPARIGLSFPTTLALLLVVVLVLFGLWPAPIEDLSRSAAAALLGAAP